MDMDLYLIAVLDQYKRITEVSHVRSYECLIKARKLIVVDLNDHLGAVTELCKAFAHGR